MLKEDDKSLLMRRLWPNPNLEETEMRGILSVIAEDIEIFEVKYFDGEEWSYEWPEEMEVLPQLVEINIVAKQYGNGNPIMESFYVNFFRSAADALNAIEGTEETEGSGETATQSGQSMNINTAN